MPFIDSSWPEYFLTRHEGLGTTYERFVLERHFMALHGVLEVASVLEAPSFGMTGISGINSLWWARQGVPVTVVDHHAERLRLIRGVWAELGLTARLVQAGPEYEVLPFGDNHFDLGWNFAALWYVDHLEAFLAELSRVCRRAILICIPNRTNPFFRPRARRLRTAHGLATGNIDPPRIISLLGGLGWRLERRQLFDAPPWPDIAMNKERLLGPLAGTGPARPLSILEHYSGRRPDMAKEVQRFGLLEGLPRGLLRFWAHHELLLFHAATGGREGGREP